MAKRMTLLRIGPGSSPPRAAPLRPTAKVAVILQAPSDKPATPCDLFGWNQAEVPSLLSYDIVLCEPPASSKANQELLQEVRQAEMGGASVLWLLSPRSSAEAIREISGLTASGLPRQVVPPHAQILDARAGEFLRAAGRYHYLLQLESDWRPMAVVPQGGLATAALARRARGFSAVLPWPEVAGIQVLEAALRLATSLFASESLSGDARRSFTKLVALGLIFCAVVTLSRFLLRFDNQRLNAQPKEVRYLASAPQTSLSLALEDFSTSELETAAALIESGDLRTLESQRPLELATLMGPSTLESELFRTATRKHLLDDPDNLRHYLNDSLLAASYTALARHRYETARYFSQRITKLVYTAAKDTYRSAHSETSGVAQKFLTLSSSNYPFKDTGVIDALAREAFGADRDPEAEDGEDATGRPVVDSGLWRTKGADQSLVDDIEYRNIAKSVENLALPARPGAWRSFELRFSKSPKAQEAAFNRLTTLLLLHVRGEGGEEASSGSLIAEANEFAEDRRHSYLADDALFLALRVADEAGQSETAQSLLKKLNSEFTEGDAIRRIRDLLRSYGETGAGLPAEDASLLADFTLEASQLPESLTLGEAINLSPSSHESPALIVNGVLRTLRESDAAAILSQPLGMLLPRLLNRGLTRWPN